MYPQHIKLFDAFLNLIGAFGLWPILRNYFRTTSLNPLESKIRNIYVCMFSLFVVRIFHLGLSLNGWTKDLIYILSVAIAMTVFLYCETLLRKHFPLWLKLFSVLGAFVFIVDALLGSPFDLISKKYFFVYVIVLQVMSLTFCIFRQQKEYGRVENTLINRNIIALIFIPTYFVTDLIIFNYNWLPRMGVLGGLLLGYISLYSQALFHHKAVAFKKVISVIGGAIVMSYVVSDLAQVEFSYFLARIIVLFLSLYLVAQIYFAVSSLSGEEDMAKFVTALTESDKTSLRSFLKNMDRFFGQVDKKFLKMAELRKYDEDSFKDIFDKCQTHLFSVYDVYTYLTQGAGSEFTNEEINKFEKIKDILEKNEMSYIFQIGKKQTYYALFHIPLTGYNPLIRMKTRLIAEIAELTEN